jgi:hypothetical protein
MADIKECCKQTANLEDVPDDRPNITVLRCTVCGCKHITMIAEPGVVGVRGAGM